jgi:hypothetical protein
MITTPNLSLIAWNLPSDPYNSEELAENWIKVDQHDHTPGKGARIDTAAIEDQAVTSAKIHPSAFPDLSIPDGSITTTKIVDSNVTAGKLATNSVTTAKITDLNVTTGKLADNAVTRSKISQAVVQGGRLSFTSDTAQTLTWANSFVDNNYTVSATYQNATLGIAFQWSPVVTAKTATQVTVTFPYPISGTVHILGIHD